MLSTFEVRMISPLAWEVYIDGKKINNVRSLTLNLEVNCVPTLGMELYLEKGTATGKAKVDGTED